MITRIPLGSICEAKIPTLNAQYNGLIDYIDISSVDNIQKKIVSKQKLLSSEAPSRAKQLLRKGDIIVSTVRPNLNAVALVDVDTDNLLVGSTGYCVLRCKEDFDRKFVFYFCQSPYFIDDMNKQATGASYPAVSGNIVKASLVPNYDVSTKHRIITYLDEVSRLISLQKAQLSKLDELVKSRFNELFGDLHSTQYSIRKMKEIATIKHGFAFAGEFFTNEDNGIVLVTPGNFKVGGGFQEEKCRFFTGKFADEYVLKTGDLIVTMTDLSKNADTLGYGAIVPNSSRVYLHNQRIGLFDYLDSTMNKVYMSYFMQTELYRKHILLGATGSTVKHTSPSRILEADVICPPLNIQTEFASFAEQTSKSKLTIQASLDKLEVLKKTLMQEYFG